MIMMEYEYSFKVNDIEPYIDFCKKDGYKKISENEQIRDLYKNDSEINARVTINKINGFEEIFLDFKEEDNSESIFKNTKESLPLLIGNDNLKSLNSILEILNYKKTAHLVRTRIIYKKDCVKFEIDKYTKPEKMNVVAIEGKKEKVDEIYQFINENIIGK